MRHVIDLCHEDCTGPTSHARLRQLNSATQFAAYVSDPNYLRQGGDLQGLGVKPELEVFDTATLVVNDGQRGPPHRPPHFNYAWGFLGSSRRVGHLLRWSLAPENCNWVRSAISRMQMRGGSIRAIGRHVRVGLEIIFT